MHDRRTTLVILLFRNPHLLESREGSENRATDPNRVLPFRWSNSLDLHGRRRQVRKLFMQTVCNARIKSSAARLDSKGYLVERIALRHFK